MKAEHRKELETNALADRMGRLLENVRQKPERGTVFYIIIGIAAFVAVFLVVRGYQYRSNENALAWFDYYRGDVKAVLDAGYAEKPQGQALRLEFAHEYLWDALRKLGVDPKGSRDHIKEAQSTYRKLRDEFENDPLLHAETLYALAQIEETNAIDDPKYLDSAKEQYEELVKKYPNSAHAGFAEKRLEILNDDAKGGKREELQRIYQELQLMLRFEAPDRLAPKK